MRLAEQEKLNNQAIQDRRCPKCGAGKGEPCFQMRLGAKVTWDQGVHKARLA
jgi:hypothetical protein